jgi:putative SOS response-associated peptidase YedK
VVVATDGIPLGVIPSAAIENGQEQRDTGHELLGERAPAGRFKAAGLVCARRQPAPALLRWHLDGLDFGANGQGGRDHEDLFAFLTTEPNREAEAVHPRAIPVILTSPGEIDPWMTAPAEDALKLQRPLAARVFTIVARGWEEGR